MCPIRPVAPSRWRCHKLRELVGDLRASRCQSLDSGSGSWDHDFQSEPLAPLLRPLGRQTHSPPARRGRESVASGSWDRWTRRCWVGRWQSFQVSLAGLSGPHGEQILGNERGLGLPRVTTGLSCCSLARSSSWPEGPPPGSLAEVQVHPGTPRIWQT